LGGEPGLALAQLLETPELGGARIVRMQHAWSSSDGPAPRA
jgi:hypothetical protein